MARLRIQAQATGSQDGVIKRLQGTIPPFDYVPINMVDELAQWKQKYEALAKLYAQLRKEHLDLLTKFKELRDSNGKVSDESRKESDKLRAELQVGF